MEKDAAHVLSVAAKGDDAANQRLMPIVYGELRRLAEHYLNGRARSWTLQPTALVHEAYLKLAGGASDVRSETHFRAVAGLAMRHVLADYARAKGTQKRGGDWARVTLSGAGSLTRNDQVDLMALHDALQRLGEVDERAAKVVQLRFFAGLSDRDTADVLQVTDRTVRNDWKMARAWLRCALSENN